MGKQSKSLLVYWASGIEWLSVLYCHQKERKNSFLYTGTEKNGIDERVRPTQKSNFEKDEFITRSL